MPNTKITKQKIKDHLSYAKKVYIFGTVIVLVACSLLFSVTRYQSPNERAVHIALVDTYTLAEKMDDAVPALLEAGQLFDKDLEEVSFMSIAYSGNANSASEDDYYGSQVYMVQLYAGDNDIYIQSETLTRDLIAQSYCLPLENMEGYDDFVLKHPDVAFLWAEEPDDTKRAEDDEESDEAAEERPQHAYAVDVTALNGMAERGAYNNKGKYGCIVAGSKNAETSFAVLAQMFNDLVVPEAEAVQ